MSYSLNSSVTIKDIARALGIHHTTVSRAFREGSSVKKETRLLIQQQAKRMGYHPNLLAKGLRNQRSNTIVVLVPDLKHHFFSNFISHFSATANAAGYSVMIFQSGERLTVEKEIIHSILSYRVAGVVASVSRETHHARHFSVLSQAGIPLVFFDRIPRGGKFAAKVLVDNRQGAYAATSHLVGLGRRKIAFLSNSSPLNVFRERLEGYRQALADHGIRFNPKYHVEGGFFLEDGILGAERLLSLTDRPDGILAITDEVGIGAIKYLRSRRLSVPRDIAVIGFDNDPMCIACSPELTTVTQSIPQLTTSSFELLQQLIQKPNFKPKAIIIQPEIIARESA